MTLNLFGGEMQVTNKNFTSMYLYSLSYTHAPYIGYFSTFWYESCMQNNVVEGLQLEEEKAQHEKEEPIRLAKERLPTNHMSF